MKKVFVAAVVAVSFLSGCASVPMESPEKTAEAKKFNPPSEGKSGLYIYRAGAFGGALKKDIWIDDKCIGESAPNVFFYEEVIGGVEHKISTESEFSPNDLLVKTEKGKNYFFNQYIKLGAFVGGANIEQVNETEGKAAIAGLAMAKKGTCSK